MKCLFLFLLCFGLHQLLRETVCSWQKCFFYVHQLVSKYVYMLFGAWQVVNISVLSLVGSSCMQKLEIRQELRRTAESGNNSLCPFTQSFLSVKNNNEQKNVNQSRQIEIIIKLSFVLVFWKQKGRQIHYRTVTRGSKQCRGGTLQL